MSKLFCKPLRGENVNTLGMFDLLKGFMLFTIIWDHTYNSFGRGPFGIVPGTSATIFDIIKGAFGLGNATIPIFVLICGYGFRPGKPKKVLKSQFDTLIKPYIYVAVIAPVCHFIVHFLCFRNLHGALKDSISMAGGLLFGLCDTAVILGWEFYSAGAVWFLLHLFIAWNILNLLFNYLKEKYIKYAVLACALFGIALNAFNIKYWSIDQAFISMIFLYLGYLIKKHDLLMFEFSLGYRILAALVYVFATAGYILTRGDSFMGGILNFFMYPLLFVILYVAVRISRLEFPIREQLSRAGRYSLWLMCAEAFTMNTFPWYMVYSSGRVNSYVAFLIILVCKIVIIYGIYRLLLFIEKVNNQKKRAARKAKINSQKESK